MGFFTAKLTVNVYITTDGNPDNNIQDLLNMFATLDTTSAGVTWDDCDWTYDEQSV